MIELIETVKAKFPDLGAYGWKHRGFTPEQHEISRPEMTSDDYVRQFERAREYLTHRRRRKTVWKRVLAGFEAKWPNLNL
jgi:hypothetical protein